MRLTTQQSQRLLTDHGCFVTDVCDCCGQVLGAVRFTRHGERGEWCSRECRDGAEAHAPGTCRSCGASLVGLRRGTRFCSDTCRKRENRKAHDGSENGEYRKSQTTQISRDEQLETQELQEGVAIAVHPGVSAGSAEVSQKGTQP